MSKQPESDDYDVVHIPVAIGWGGMIVRDGVGSPMPEETALEHALPLWAEEVQDTSAVIALCLRALGHEPVSLRVVALETLARVAARPEPLSRLAEVRREIRRALDDDDPRLRSAAWRTLIALERHQK
jgi:hypothetical protein